MSLTKLPAPTVKLITSTQIITSVASAVKELMENSLDAGAKNIDIKLENNGLDLIEVRDDGCGIKRSDTSNMALPNYTSKISNYADLEKLVSYGFRGEALNALCQVATVSVTTRTCEDEYAMVYTLDTSGNVLVSKPSSLGKGTVVTVKRLFYNLPVRKQYITSNRRRISEELKRVESIVKSLAIIHPQLRVTFCNDKCLLWQKTACQNLRQSLMQVASHFITNELDELSMKESELSIEMLIPKKTVRNIQSLCQSSNEAMMIYINNRPVRYKKLEKMVLKYVSEHFSEQLPLHRYPVCLVSIVTSPSELDVNLEPNKTQVMLKEEDQVLSKIEDLLATYYEILTHTPHKVDEIDIPENLNISSSSETTISESSNIHTNKELSEDEPMASKRMKLDVSNVPLGNKRLPGVVQNTRVELTQLGKEVLLNGKDSNQNRGEPVEKTKKLYQVKKLHDEFLTTNAPTTVNDGWTIIELNSVNKSDAASGNVSSGISNSQNLTFGQNFSSVNSNLRNSESFENVNCRKLDSEISKSCQNITDRISNSDNTGSVQHLNSEIPNSENSKSDKRLGDSSSKFFTSKYSSIRGSTEIQRNLHNDKEVGILESAENSKSTLVEKVFESKATNETAIEDANLRELGNETNIVQNEIQIPQDRTNFNDSLFDNKEISDFDCINLDLECDFALPTIPEKAFQSEILCEKDLGSKCSTSKPESIESKGQNENLFEITDQAMEKWSMGMLKAQNGKMLQGSAVMLPKVTVDSFNTSCQSVSSQMGQKEQSAFTKFSRDERPKILKEFPSIAFTKVAELLVERWRALPEEERRRYEQIAIELDDKRKSKMQEIGLQKLDTFVRQLNVPVNKPEGQTRKEPPKDVSKLKPKSELKLEKRPKRPKRKKQTFEVSIQNLKQICLGVYTKPRCDSSSWALIGKLKPSGEWLYKKDKELGVVCHWGLQEIVLYHRLMVDHTVPLKKLDSKIMLDESLLGPDLWNILLSLNKAYDVVDNAVTITSDVISKNGFKIQVQEGRSSCMLTEVASTINFYGVNDLKDVLKLVKNHGCGSLEKCRNLRVMSYIRDEAVRIVRQCSAVMEQDTLQDLINYWQLNLSHLGATCLHRKPIFHVLKDLSGEGL